MSIENYKYKILVVEDEIIVAMDIKRQLIELGYEVSGIITRSNDVHDAVKTLLPDLVLMDIMLNGELDGIRQATGIKNDFGIPIIFLTAYADDSTLQLAKISEPFGYIIKPFEKKDLRSNIEIALYKAAAEKKVLLAKMEAERANEAKSVFLSNISHEIRTPMNGIIGLTDLLLEMSPSEEQKEYLELIKNCSVSLTNLLNNILDYSRLEAGKTKLHEEEFELSSLVKDTYKSMLIHAKNKKLDFEYCIDEKLQNAFLSDQLKIKQVLINLVSNAIKFTDKGIINIFVRDLEHENNITNAWQYIHFIVKDTGIGIPVEKQDDIFNCFVQGETSYSNKYEGAGLGLSISREIILLMQGKIWLVSSPGKGSEFHFIIPLKKNNSKI